MTLSSHLLQRMLKLPPPSTRDVVVQRDIRVPMPDPAGTERVDRRLGVHRRGHRHRRTERAVVAAGGTQVRARDAIPRIGWVSYFTDTEGNLFNTLQSQPTAL
jgi:hypothetical protein